MTLRTRSSVLVLLLVAAAPLLHAQIPNAGFENWTSGEPDGWITNNFPGTPAVTQSDTVHSGSSAARGEVVSVFSFPFPPYLYSTDENANGFPVNQRWAELRGWYKLYTPAADRFFVSILMTAGDSAIGIGGGVFPAIGSYTAFSAPITYISPLTPDTAFITITIVGDSISGNPTLGAAFHVDDLSLSGVSSAGETRPELPADLALAQNFPNPFNPATRIDFRITEAGPVTLRVYDILGREVATLVDERLAAGVHSRSFDASGIPSGVYLYRLTAGGRSESRKMMLLR